MKPRKPVVKVDKMTRNVIARYPSCRQASLAEGYGEAALAALCRNGGLPTGRFYYRHAEGFDPEEDFDGKRNCPVIVKDRNTGRVKWFPSGTSCARALMVTNNSLRKNIKDGGWVAGRFRAAYCTRRAK